MSPGNNILTFNILSRMILSLQVSVWTYLQYSCLRLGIEFHQIATMKFAMGTKGSGASEQAGHDESTPRAYP